MSPSPKTAGIGFTDGLVILICLSLLASTADMIQRYPRKKDAYLQMAEAVVNLRGRGAFAAWMLGFLGNGSGHCNGPPDYEGARSQEPVIVRTQ